VEIDMPTNQRKALIIGCGIAGPVTALFLQRAGIEATIYEAHPAPQDEAGAFLVLAPNGVNVLKTLGLDGEVQAAGFEFAGMRFVNGAGKAIGQMDNRGDAARYGAGSVLIKRGLLHKCLREAALRQGIRIKFGKKLTGLETPQAGGVIAHFADGTTASGDFLIGCDGIHSRTRRLILPNAPAPQYTGLVDCGGFTRAPQLADTGGWMHMIFGQRAFFGYCVTPDGEVFWFNNTPYRKEPTRDELQAISTDAWRQQLLALHAHDPEPVPTLLGATTGEIGKWPVYDIPFLPTWHQGPVCLVGDAAHATSPHAGQGASMALEDAIVLAKCVRDIPDLERAFIAYQLLRKERVEEITRQARRTGQSKSTQHPLALWLRDRLLPLFLQLGARANRRVFDYRVAWESQSAPATGSSASRQHPTAKGASV
jgi:2-polyprenyl-6-methoxyphenol hydroxylase-like FAD-dependent oxidoreductase